MMSAMDKMLAEMVKNILPKEVIDILSPENMKAIGDQIAAFLTKQEAFQNDVTNQLAVINTQLERILSNEHRNESGKRDGSGGKSSGSVD